jgi:signal transduction histidine kinase
MTPSPKPLRPSRPGTIAAYLVYAAVVARTLAIAEPEIRNQLPWYLGFFATYLVLFTALLWRPRLRPGWLHLYFVVQSSIVVALLSLSAHLDFLTTPFVLLSFQAGLVFTGRTRSAWIGVFILLTGGTLVVHLGLLRGLALGLIPMAFCIVYPAYVTVSHEIEKARAQSQAMLGELQETHRQLQAYAERVEELAAMEERNRLARALHDSVSQTMFSIVLNIRSMQILLERDPARIRPQLEQLQELTQNVLADMRSLIAKLRPPGDMPRGD